MRTEDQRLQDRGDLQQMIAQPLPGEDALAAAAMLELCRTLDEAVEQGRAYAASVAGRAPAGSWRASAADRSACLIAGPD
jgi:hypothetical protein